jgi:endogenous inhibitor of DNA gyrase (YacG/DUF329 family)
MTAGSEPGSTSFLPGSFLQLASVSGSGQAGQNGDMATESIRCPACGQMVEIDEAEEKASEDPHAPLTCPTCGAGFDREGTLRHEPAIGP